MSDKTHKFVEETDQKIFDLLSKLTPEDRIEALYIAKAKLCFYCGYEQLKHGVCQCWNDE